MPLTPGQLTTLNTAIAANTNQIVCADGVTRAINAITGALQTPDNAFAVANWYNLLPATPFYGYYTGVPIAEIVSAIRWARLTPSDAVTATNFTQISLGCQGYQFNVQLLIGTQPTLDATQHAIIQGFHDSLSAVPSAGAGATQDAGWTTAVAGGVPLPSILSRLSSNIEALLANTTAWGQGGSGASQTPGSTGPATLTFQGTILYEDIQAAWAV